MKWLPNIIFYHFIHKKGLNYTLISISENEIWTVTTETNLCIQRSEEISDPLFFATIDECSEMCKKVSSMFAYGTNDYGTTRCNSAGCTCLCETAASKDGTCSQTSHNGYRLYKYKTDGNISFAYFIYIIFISFLHVIVLE